MSAFFSFLFQDQPLFHSWKANRNLELSLNLCTPETDHFHVYSIWLFCTIIPAESFRYSPRKEPSSITRRDCTWGSCDATPFPGWTGKPWKHRPVALQFLEPSSRTVQRQQNSSYGWWVASSWQARAWWKQDRKTVSSKWRKSHTKKVVNNERTQKEFDQLYLKICDSRKNFSSYALMSEMESFLLPLPVTTAK